MKKIMIGIVLVLLVGVMSASLIEYYGQIVWSVEVSGPVFYLDGNFDLLLNDEPSNFEVINMSKGDSEFTSIELNLESLYAANFDIFIWAKAYFDGDTLSIDIVSVNFENSETLICQDSIDMSNTDNFSKKSLSCSSEELVLDTSDKLRIKVSGDGEIRNHNPSKNDFARIEVSKI